VFLTPDRIWLANAGDSRAIMCRKGRAVQISRDHKSDSIDEKKRIQALHGFITEDRRVNGMLALSRALGDTEQQPHVTYRPDVLEMDVSDAIEHLILACDGLWDVLSNDQVVEYVKVRASTGWLPVSTDSCIPR
jgi:serine/threonine protein phosphatase PrpC